MADPTFTPTRTGVLMTSGPYTATLTEAQVAQYLALWRDEQRAAQAVVDRCEALWNALSDADFASDELAYRHRRTAVLS